MSAERMPDPHAGSGKPSYVLPLCLGVVGAAVAGRRAARSGHPQWPYWAVGVASTGVIGWVVLTVMPAALGRGPHARSLYGQIPRDETPDTYVPEGVPGVTDVPGVEPEHHHHELHEPVQPATAVELAPEDDPERRPGRPSD